MLLSLPAELLLEIGEQLSDVRDLRLACKALCFATNPVFYSSFVLTTSRLHKNRTRHILKAITKGKIAWTHAKKLTIIPGERREGNDPVGPAAVAGMNQMLTTALRSMNNIRTIQWTVDADASFGAICAAVNNLPLLENLYLDGSPVNLPLAQVSGLRRLKISLQSQDPALKSDKISRLISQNPRLTTLHLFSGPLEWQDVWTSCKTSQIRLKDLRTDAAGPALHAYLISYSGLEMLRLRPSLSNPRFDNDLAPVLYGSILPLHASSLVHLSCCAIYESRWSFDTHAIATISALRKLETLRVSVNTSEMPVEPERNAVDLLLETVASLPRLRFLEIDAADVPRPWTGNACRRGDFRAQEIAAQRVVRALEKFRSSVVSAAIVFTNGRYYEPVSVQPNDGHQPDGTLGYREIDDCNSAKVRQLEGLRL
ncbi:hypothetical protein C8R43DRAFT_108675 [Mycena crocata]|nr:hypothetical protein C8R43DRAFT_108675 [Mycena crocata]